MFLPIFETDKSMYIMNKTLRLFFSFFIISVSLHAQETKLASLFSDNMILQRNIEGPIWGWAEPGSQIKIQCSWDNDIHYGHTDIEGKWMVEVTTPDAGGPYSIKINEKTIKNVLIGEVWIASGQSNMQLSLQQSENYKDELSNATDDEIRLFYVAREHSDYPNDDIYGRWETCDTTSAKTFSAVGYYFAKRLRAELNIPIGIIHVSWGGSSAQAWVSPNVLKACPSGQHYLVRYAEKVMESKPGIIPRNHQSPSSLYNGMLKPLIPFAIKGAIWYQGEANRDRPDLYKGLMTNLIQNWRAEWRIGDFPFYYVQLAPFIYNEIDMGAFVRDAQKKTLDVPNTGMAVTMDIGNLKDIHPKNKKDVGMRLALWALSKDYGKRELVYSGPLFKSAEFTEKEAILSFNSVGSGLQAKGKKLELFEIAGEDRIFHVAKGFIENDKIILKSRKVKWPVAVRYACHDIDEASLFNKEGLPAPSFRTDSWPINK